MGGEMWLAKTLAQSYDNRWCDRLFCTTCCQFEIRHELFKELMGNHICHWDEGNRPKIFPYSLDNVDLNEYELRQIFLNIDIILDEVLKTRRLPLAIAKQSTMISIKNLYDNLDRKLSEYDKIRVLKENGKALGLDNRQLYRFEEIKDFESLVSDINDRYLNSLWIILSAIEDFIPRLAEPEFKYLEKRLDRLITDRRDYGWIYKFREKKMLRHHERIPDGPTKREIRAQKKAFLEGFKRMSAVEQLKLIARDREKYRIEFFPVDSVYGMLNEEVKYQLTQEEKDALCDWIGPKGGVWSSLKHFLRKPYLVRLD